ncbi:RlpA-like double-psi beta-barrel-protein domain-containing protein-containing protein [Radiomyces spectabilis]|uniref:RlpA-like double-psi beta-barrel-protein domain-containing protein-containing protein n=1 Tax=Radiomyces spectabilis TaxID=64574 RepID=UPI00221F8C3A|nr:RlpA-like double-psi beta-barrel-protein domain-containing protein-containing protein [Radiomyces spectabilis]KAI8381188.1 RlpA-like double-psi beta-barrel-protein domain-containing protein-containing protein [Radiomyces spectabilis]
MVRVLSVVGLLFSVAIASTAAAPTLNTPTTEELASSSAETLVQNIQVIPDMQDYQLEKRQLEKRGKKTYKGRATWFSPAREGGDRGACGPKENDNSLIVALNKSQYGNMSKKSKWCGKKLRVKGPKGSITVTVNDACPGCKYGDLDLTPRVFKKIVGDFDIGVAKISWSEL